MINTVLEFVKNYWSDAISFISLILSIYATRRSIISDRQANQEQLFADLDRLLDDRCNCFTSEQKAMGCYSPSPSVSIRDEQAIIRKVCRIFGHWKYWKLNNILKLCNEAKTIDMDIGTIFDAIKECEPERYAKIGDVLLASNDLQSEQEIKKSNEFLSSISISMKSPDPAEDEKMVNYNYLELSNKLSKLNSKIARNRESLEKSLNRAMLKR